MSPRKNPIRIIIAPGNNTEYNNLFTLIRKKLPASEIEKGNSQKQILQLIESFEPAVIFISDEFKNDKALALLSAIKVLAPLIPVILILNKRNKLIAADKKIADDFLYSNDLTAILVKKSIEYNVEKLKINKNLQDAVERCNLLTLATNNIIWDWDLKKRSAYWVGNGLMQILGYNQQEMLVDTHFWETNLHPDDKDRVINKLNNIFKKANQNNWEDEYRFRHKDGSYSYIYDRGFIIYHKGKPVRFLGSMEDISERKIAEASKANSEKNYKNLFDQNPLATFIWNRENFKIIDANETALNEYGYTKDEFLNLDIFKLRPVEDIPKFKKIVVRALQDKILMHDHTWVHKNKKGESILMQVSSYQINYKGQPAVLALAKNITEKIALSRKLEREKNIKEKQIAEAVVSAQEKERTEIGKELHDNVNQLLSASRLYIDAARSGKNDSNALLIQASDYVMTAIEEIRVLSRALNTPLIQEIGFIETVENLAYDIMQVKKIKIVVDKNNFSEDHLAENFKLTLFRIVQEQVTNILKHSKATKAAIILKRNEQHISIEIRDNGIGFDKNKKACGMGMKNIYSRVALYKGDIKISSGKTNGTLLKIIFPLDYLLNES